MMQWELVGGASVTQALLRPSLPHPHPTHNRYAHLLLLIDTCQAASLCATLSSPNVVCITSSVLGGSRERGHCGCWHPSLMLEYPCSR